MFIIKHLKYYQQLQKCSSMPGGIQAFGTGTQCGWVTQPLGKILGKTYLTNLPPSPKAKTTNLDLTL